ncbi:MAG: hypothetical protein J0L73_14400 [Verrucomicrobia bacterium]|nr:hypothetical protein [Verrucomicrobiota bacterium]
MKHLPLALLLLVSFATCSLADSPEAILKDYRKQASQAVERLNQSLEKAATPLITKLVSSGDTAGAELLTSQMKAKIAGEPVAAPQASAVQLFSLYDDARAKALAPVQKSSIARIDGLLKTAGGAKLETVTELGKVREEIEAGKVSASLDQFFVGKSFFTKAGSEYHFNKEGTGYRLQKMDFEDKVPFTWTQRSDGIVEVLQRKQPKAVPTATFFRFVDKKSAYQGDSDTNISTPLGTVK